MPNPTPTLCGADGCTNPATHQAPRAATEQEATAHWDALEANIRASGNPDYVQNRDDTVVKTEYRCDHPDHAHPGHLEALANQEDTDV
jgi:hypothetical protein